MKEPEGSLRRASGSRGGSPDTTLEGQQVLDRAVLKAQTLRESRKLSWVGYGDLIKTRTEEAFTRPLSATPTLSRRSSPDLSRAPSRGPSPMETATPSTRASPIDIRPSFQSEPSDLYSFPKSKTHVRFSASLPNLPPENSPIRRDSSSPELQVGPIPPPSPESGRPSFVGLLGSDSLARRAVMEAPINVTYTPRVPGDEAWREGAAADPPAVEGRLDDEGLSFRVPDYLAALRGTSREGALGPRPSNIAGVPVMGSHRRSTFVRAVEAVTNLGASLLAPSTERRTSKYVTMAPKTRMSTVIVPVNAKQWLLQSLRMKDWELRELFDQMEMIPQLAADHVREVRAEWESLEARSLKVPPEADMLLKDQQLLDRTKALLRRFIEVVSEDDKGEERRGGGEESQHPQQDTPEISEGDGSPPSEQGEENDGKKDQVEAFREQLRRERDSISSSFGQNRGSVSPALLQRDRSGSVLGKPVCPSCGRLDTTAPNTIIRGGVLPRERESIFQSRGPSPIPHHPLPSFIPFEDYVVKQSIVKPTGKSDQFKTTYSPLDKRWYTVLFPALQPGKREDVTLLSEWLCHATQRNGVEDADGHFTNVETAFVLHSIAFLEVVRQVRIHCEERGDMILHVWRQLLRIFNQVMTRAEPTITALEEEVGKSRITIEQDKKEITRLAASLEIFTKKYHDTDEKLRVKDRDLHKIRRCRLCLAGNMTPRTRENYIRKSMMKRFSGSAFSGGEKSRSELLQESIQESKNESTESKKGKGTKKYPPKAPPANPASHSSPAAESKPGEATVAAQPETESGVTKEQSSYATTTVITFLRAALLKRSQRPSLDEAAKIQVETEMALINSTVPQVTKEDKLVQTDPVTVSEIPKYASVLKRSASCPARLFWVEIFDPELRARHRSWLQENGLIGGQKMVQYESEGEGQDDEVEVVVGSIPTAEELAKLEADTAEGQAPGEGMGASRAAGNWSTVHKKMKKHVNKLANETMDLLSNLGEQLSGVEGDVGSKMQAMIAKWKKVARATSGLRSSMSSEGGVMGEVGEGGTEGGVGDDFVWEDGDEGEGEDRKGRRRRKGKGRKGSGGTAGMSDGEEPGRSSRRSIFEVAAEVLKRSKRGTGKFSSNGSGFELGKIVPLGFAKMMNINSPPKVIKFFNERQLTKLITAVYMAKIEADIVDDEADGERQSSCEFVYDFMLNLYGLKRLAESAVWGLFKKIKWLQSQRKIDKAHKARLFNRFCGMDETKFYSERDLYLYLKVLAKGISKGGLFYPSELDDGISYVNSVWAEFLAEEPNLIEHFGSQTAAAEFINAFVASHAVTDKVSLEVKKITKSQIVKRIDFDELMEAILEKGSIQQTTIFVPRKVKKGLKPKTPLTEEKRRALENLFTAGDANQDGVLTFTEFREILSSADPSLSQQQALRIFRETLLLEPEGGDKISPLAFATVAHNHDIAAPPAVIFSLLKKTYLQIQGDVNDNKIKDEASKKESDDLRMKLAKLIDRSKESETDAAVQTFKEYVLKFCGTAEGEADEEQEEEEEEEEEEEVNIKRGGEAPLPESPEEDDAGPSRGRT